MSILRPKTRVGACTTIIGVVVALNVAILALWALQPLKDSVPVGIDYSTLALNPPKAAIPVSQRVSCNSLFDSAARDGDPLPTLKEQPADRPALVYNREPCELVHQQARIVWGIDIAISLLVIAGCVVLIARPRRQSRAAMEAAALAAPLVSTGR